MTIMDARVFFPLRACFADQPGEKGKEGLTIVDDRDCPLKASVVHYIDRGGEDTNRDA